jgi:hypothetical protein
LEPRTNIHDTLQRDAIASAELPASATKGVDPDTVKVIRTRLNTLDPVQILGEYASAAASGDMATLIAVNEAHAGAYPNIHTALAANPAIRYQAATQVRRRVNPDAERWAEDKRTLADGIGAIVGDVERLVGSLTKARPRAVMTCTFRGMKIRRSEHGRTPPYLYGLSRPIAAVVRQGNQRAPFNVSARRQRCGSPGVLGQIEAGRAWCHRHLVAAWLKGELGIEVGEL